jgi:hypothetical protein
MTRTIEAARHARGTWRSEPITATALFFGSLALCWARLPVATRNVLWAEDARDFLPDALRSGGAGAIFEPYAGYGADKSKSDGFQSL